MPQEVYNDLEIQKDLLVKAQQFWKDCQRDLRRSKAEARGLREEVQASSMAGDIRTRLANVPVKNDVLKVTIAEFREEVIQYAEQLNWQHTASAGSNAEAQTPEVKVRGDAQPFERDRR
jgi:hypothetical protein